jgi:integrase
VEIMNRVEIIEKFEKNMRVDKKDILTINDHKFTAEKVFDIIGDNCGEWYNDSMIDLKDGLTRYIDKDGEEKTYATTTLNKHLMGAKIFIGFLFEMQRSLDVDLSNLDKEYVLKKLKKVKLSDSEKEEIGEKPINYQLYEGFVRFLLNSGEGRNTVRSRVIVLLALCCGLRKTEIHMIKRADISFEDNMLYLKDTKNEKHRNVPIQDFILDEIKKMYGFFPPSEYVFVTDDGNHICDTQISRSVKSLATRAFKKDVIDVIVKPHGCRKSYAGYLHFVKGIPAKVIQELLGHSNLKTTEEHYLKVNKNDVKDEILSIDMRGNKTGEE